MKKTIVFVLVVLILFVAARFFDFAALLAQLRRIVESYDALGPVIFIVFYALAVTALVPGSALTIAAGAIFGSFWGVVIVSIASTTGSGLSFLISRYFARSAVSKWVQKNEKFKLLDEMTLIHGEIIVAVTRLVPLFPYTLLNYGFGLTKVSFKTYIFWSWLCMLPGTALYVVGTDVVVQAVANGKIQPEHIAVIVFAFILIWITAKYAKRFLQRGKKQ